MFHTAPDVSLRAVAVCIIDHDGKMCFERSDVPDSSGWKVVDDDGVGTTSTWLVQARARHRN